MQAGSNVIVIDCLAGTSSKQIQPPVTRHVLPDRYSTAFMKDPATGATQAKADPEPCHQFNADKMLGRTSKVFDINGIVTAQCRCVVPQQLAEVLHCCVWLQLTCIQADRLLIRLVSDACECSGPLNYVLLCALQAWFLAVGSQHAHWGEVGICHHAAACPAACVQSAALCGVL